MATDVEREIRRFARRVQVGRFFGGATQALAAAALATAAVLLVLRLMGTTTLPDPRWLVLLVVPALAGGWIAVRRTGFGRRASAVHLDRRLGLDGLLLTAMEHDAGAYRDQLDARLVEARDALPRIEPRPLASRLVVSALVLLAVFLAPFPTQDAAAANPLGAEALAEFQAKLEALEAEEQLDEEIRDEVSQRFDRLAEGFEKDGELDWSDLDALERQLDNERNLQVARLAQTMQDMEAFARGEDSQLEAGDAAAAERMEALLKQAAESGLLDKLPPGLKDRLGAQAGANGEGLSLEGLDAETLKQLAGAMAQSAGDALEGLDAGELLQDLELSDLTELLEGEPCKLCNGEAADG